MQCPRCNTAIKAEARFCPVCGAGLPAFTGRLSGGMTLIDRYEVLRPLARGGMGAVYLATDRRLGNAPVALKEMAVQHAPGDTAAWQQAVAEFQREAALLARLSHPNLPHVIDQFESDGNQFLVMELVEGRTLRAELKLRTEPLSLDEAMNWFTQLVSVLRYLHAQQPPIIYRDLKPTNIMLRPDGRIVLIDFGIARLYKPGQAGDTAIYGTPGYAPPEQYGLGQTDVRSDVYSLAMVFHELLTGSSPMTRAKARPVLASTLRPDLPAHIAAAIDRALALDPDDRFGSVEEFAAAVQPVSTPATYVTTPPVAAVQPDIAATAPPLPAQSAPSRWLWMVGTLVLLLIIGGGAWAVLNRHAADVPATATTQASASDVPAATATAPAATATAPTNTPATQPVILPPPPGMVAVPAGDFTLGSDEGNADERPQSTGYLPTFYLDRTETTVAAYRACVEAGACSPPQDQPSVTRPDYYTNPAYDQFPIVNVTWEQARQYCNFQGKRLPTEAEWEKAARGPNGFTYPWGDEWDAAKLNAWGDLIGGDTLAVGSYPAGASPYGALDMAGNVWEWTSSLDQPYPYNATDGRELPNRSGARIIRGGAWGDDPANARATDRDRRDSQSFTNNLGVRCATSDGFVPEGMDYIPGGTWTMGAGITQTEAWSAQYQWPSLSNERPAFSITTAPFYLDRTEVTNAQYAEFVAATGHNPPRNAFDPQGLAIWNQDNTIPVTLTEHPVVNVTWQDAVDYCAWAGKRLPTEAEWERAARDDDGRLWPWGAEWDATRTNTSESGIGLTQAVGTYPQGAGPYGTLDLAGNVWEWLSSRPLPYPYRADDGREDAAAYGSRVLRGGSWLDERLGAHTTGRNSLDPALSNVNVGLRCALDAP